MTNYAPSRAYNFIMDVIYIDRLFALNLLLDYLLALCTARICGVRLRRWRYLGAAALGAVYAAASVFPALGFLTTAPVKLIFGLLMALTAYGDEEKWLRCALAFFAVSALFGGAVWAISAQSGGMVVSAAVIPVSTPVLVLAFAVIYAVLSTVFRRSMKNADIAVSSAQLTLGGRSIELRCLHDSGNALFDPMLGDRVLIASSDTLSPLFGEKLSGDCMELIASPELSGRARLIPYSAVGTASGMLAAFRPDEISLDGKVQGDIIVAISPTPVGGDGFDAIL